jgi:hypothetical protein
VWGRTFAGLGITYQGSVMTLDLCDRQGKYSNGFCHWPQVRFVCFSLCFVPPPPLSFKHMPIECCT